MLLKDILHFLITYLRFYLRLGPAGRAAHTRDRLGLPPYDPGIENAIKEGVSWICRAQDNSASQDGGVATHFSLISGWSASYPETTGYIVPTLLQIAGFNGEATLRHRAKRMLDWLVSIQFPDGSFLGGSIDSKKLVPVTFNTGQILLGLSAGVREFGEAYLEPMCRVADWLVRTQGSDGCWRAYPSPYSIPGEKAYDTHVAWALLEASKIEPNRGYAEAALSNVNWALRLQKENGWFEKCCVSNPSQPLTHTLGYVFRGILEAYRFTDDANLLEPCNRLANGLLTAIRTDGFLPGRLLSNWQGAVSWACLTGSVQIAYCWIKMYQLTGNTSYRDAAFAANQYVRRTMKLDGSPETIGAIGGSFPIYGGYCQYAYPNWACKFFIDSNLIEKHVKERS